MTEAHDYSDYAEETDDDKLAQLSRLALQQQDAEKRVAEAKAVLDEAQAELNSLKDVTIPELMLGLGIKKVQTACGLTVIVKEQLRVSVPKAKKVAAYAWLDENGASPLLKRAFQITFSKEELAWAAKFERDCKQRKKPLHIERTLTVASASLKKFLTESLEEGVDVPLELFGAYHQKESKIST